MVTGGETGAEGPLIRIAERRDVEAIVSLFAADGEGGHGDTTDPNAAGAYLAAFERISRSPNDTLYVAELDGEVVGTFQTTLIPGMPGRGGTSFQIEAVQTRKDMRSRGIGALMITHAVGEAKAADARLVQLMSNACASARTGFMSGLASQKAMSVSR